MENTIKAKLTVPVKREVTALERARAYDDWMRNVVKSNFYAQEERMFNNWYRIN